MSSPALRIAGMLAIAACSHAQREEATARATDASDEPVPGTASQSSLNPSADAAIDDVFGTLIVHAFNKGGKHLARVRVRVDGNDRCSLTPCRLSDLPAGLHTVAVSARGASAPFHEVMVLAKQSIVDAVVLEPPAASLKVTQPSGLGKIPTAVEMWLDGRLIGTLPQCFRGLKVGAHSVSLYEVPIFDRRPGGRGLIIYRRELLLPANRTLALDPGDRPGKWTTSLSSAEPSQFGFCTGLPTPSVDEKIRAVRRRCGALAKDQEMSRSVNIIVRPRGEVVVAHALVETTEDEALVECVAEQTLAWKFAVANDYSSITFKFRAKQDPPPPVPRVSALD